MSTSKYNYEQTFAIACNLAPHHRTMKSLAEHMDMPKQSLADIVDRFVDAEEGQSKLVALKNHAAAANIDISDASLTQQMKYWRTRAQSAEKQLGQREWFLDTLRETVSVLQTKPVTYPEPYEIPTDKSGHVAQLLLSDLHYGLKAQNLGVFPEYNSEIAAIAIEEVFLRSLSIIEKMSRSYMDVQSVIINLAGDMVEHNFLRKGHRGQVDRHVVKQVVELARILGANIKVYARNFPKVYVTGVPGNHGRADPVPGAGDPTESFDWLLFQFLEEILDNQDNVETFFPECWYSLVRVYDNLVFTMHGEDIRSWASVPWYGLSKAIKNLVLMLTHVTKRELRSLDKETTLSLGQFLDILKIPDSVLIGHFHTAIDWDEIGIDAICNGSLVGSTKYSLKRLRQLSRPCQKLLFFHPEWGLVEDRKIFLHDVVERFTPEEGEMPKVLQVG